MWFPGRLEKEVQLAERDKLYGHLPRLIRAAFASEDLFRCGLVVAKNEHDQEILSEDKPLDPNYINWIRTGFPRGLENGHPETLLYLMLRHAALLEQARAGLSILQQRGLINKKAAYERELVKITADEPTVFEYLDQRVPGLTGQLTLKEYLNRPKTGPMTPQERIVRDFRDALGVLESLSSAELERLFTETLDVCAYRLDAWITALATKRLAAMREAQPLGSYVGAYGFVEKLKPFPPGERNEVAIEGEGAVTSYTYNGGYVCAPSMTHAAAAAVLRSAYMTRSGEQRRPYAVNLSSARVRTALWLLDSVREGQPLGAALGYLFERGLHDGGLDRFIDDFRGKYPIIANRMADSGEPAESVAARNVVDGYALVQDWRANGTAPWADIGPSEAVIAVVRSVDDSLDALADLLTAEAVYQLVGGSVEGAGASLDAMAKGAHPPDPQIARGLRGGTAIIHRVALVLGNTPPLGDEWPLATRRAQVEPLLDAWAGRILGDPSRVIARVSLRGQPDRRVTLRDLGLRPLDILVLAVDEAPNGADSELDRRVIAVAASQTVPAPAPDEWIGIQYDPPELAADERSFLEVLEIARAIRDVVRHARPLAAKDLLVPEEAFDVEARGAGLRRAELQDRADKALASLTDTIGRLDAALGPLDDQGHPTGGGDLRGALQAASLLGVPSAFPPLTDDGLLESALSVRTELKGRHRAAVAAKKPEQGIRNVFGRDVMLLPRFNPASADELAQALANEPHLGADAETTVTQWLAQAARVRRPLGDWRLLSLYRGTFEGPAPVPKIVQLPFAAGARWVGLPFRDPGEKPPPAGRVSIALVDSAPPTAHQAWAGLLLDEWVELIPNAREDAGVVFHYDRPGSEAPQAVLLAVPPGEDDAWHQDLLIRIVRQTIENARLRGFDGEWKRSGGELGHAFYGNPWLPMMVMADNPEDETIATSFTGCLERKES